MKRYSRPEDPIGATLPPVRKALPGSGTAATPRFSLLQGAATAVPAAGFTFADICPPGIDHPQGSSQLQLTVTAAGDQYEQEADQVAHEVMQRLSAPSPRGAPLPSVRARAYQQLAPRLAGDPTQTHSPSPQAEAGIAQARGGGQQLPEATLHAMGQAFGHHFANVRVHADERADRLTRSLSAQAFTVGADIFFRRGMYAPASAAGQQLLAHELTHVVQQSGAAQSQTTAEGEDTSPGSIPISHHAHAQVIQRAFAVKLLGSSYTPVVGMTIEEIFADTKERDQEETQALFNDPEYYDYDEWKENGKKVKVDKAKVQQPEAQKEEEILPPAKPKPITEPPPHLREQALPYVNTFGVDIASLGGSAGKEQLQVIVHTSDAAPEKMKTPEDRSTFIHKRIANLMQALEAAKIERAKLGEEGLLRTLTVFVAPEAYFSLPDQIALHFSKAEYELIVKELKGISSKYKGILIIPGSINWSIQPEKPLTSEAELGYRGGGMVPPESIEYTFNTCPVVYNGQVFLYDKHVDTGGDVTRPQHNMYMQEYVKHMDKNEATPRRQTAGLFTVDGLVFGLEICGDHGEGVLEKALQQMKAQKLNVDFYILIAKGQSVSQTAPAVNGWAINVDANDKGVYRVYKIANGKPVEKATEHKPQKQAIDGPFTNTLSVLDKFLKVVGTN